MAEQHAVEDDPRADGDQQGGAARGVRAGQGVGQDAFDANLEAVETVTRIAKDHGAAPGQVALAWLLAKAPDVVPISGTLHSPAWKRTPRRPG